MLRLLKYLFLPVIFSSLCISANAQFDDIGLWTGISVEKQLTRSISGSLTEQLRLKQDIGAIDVLLSDAGIEYAISKKFKTSLHYRFIQSNQENYYSKRHRLYLDLTFKQKVSLVSFSLRERIQEQYTDILSSDNGKIPVWTLRTKLTAKFDVEKKYFPYLSSEVYYLLDNAKETDHVFTRLRIETGFTYEFNRVHSVNPFALYQHALTEKYNELIFGVMYGLSF